MSSLETLYPKNMSINFVNATQSLFGSSYVLIPDLNVQKNACGGWHVDSGSEIPNRYLLAQDYMFAKCGVYLQGNTQEWGGGIDLQSTLFTGMCAVSYRKHKII